MANCNIAKNYAENPTWPCPTNQSIDKKITSPEKNCCEIPTTSNENMKDHPMVTSLDNRQQISTFDNCFLPRGLAEQTETRPAVDKHTISRYSLADWRSHNEAVSNDAKKVVRDAKNVIFNARLMDGQIYLPVDVNESENSFQIQYRAQIIFQSRVKLEKFNSEITDEIEKIQQLIQQLMRCNRTVDLIVSIDRDTQKMRNMRLSPDLVHDVLTDELNREMVLCAEIINLNTRFIDEIKKQIKELKDTKQRLEHDWSNKKSAYNIDTACMNVNRSSAMIQWKPGCAHLSDGQSTPAAHEYFTKETVTFTQAALVRSRILRENVKDMIEKSAKDLRIQANFVEMTLMEKINETFRACKTLERALNKCLRSLADTEIVFEKINGAVRKLDAPMKCAQTRLDMRLKRENVENCRDVPQFGLIDEVKNISECVSGLLSQAKSAEVMIETLSKSRQSIEKEIAVKQKTLWIDNERCKLLRSFYPTDQALRGYQ